MWLKIRVDLESDRLVGRKVEKKCEPWNLVLAFFVQYSQSYEKWWNMLTYTQFVEQIDVATEKRQTIEFWAPQNQNKKMLRENWKNTPEKSGAQKEEKEQLF